MRKVIDTPIFFADNPHGWPFSLWLGSNPTKGWVLEFDMDGGNVKAALTPAGQDPVLLLQVEQHGPTPYSFDTVVRVQVQLGKATWDPEKRELVIETREEG